MNDLLKVLRDNTRKHLRSYVGDDGTLALVVFDASENKTTLIWGSPDLQSIANEIEALVDGYYPDWASVVFEYGVDYVHGEGLVWSIVNLTVTLRDDTEVDDDEYNITADIEDHGKYPFLAEALIDTIYRGEEVKS